MSVKEIIDRSQRHGRTPKVEGAAHLLVDQPEGMEMTRQVSQNGQENVDEEIA